MRKNRRARICKLCDLTVVCSRQLERARRHDITELGQTPLVIEEVKPGDVRAALYPVTSRGRSVARSNRNNRYFWRRVWKRQSVLYQGNHAPIRLACSSLRLATFNRLEMQSAY